MQVCVDIRLFHMNWGNIVWNAWTHINALNCKTTLMTACITAALMTILKWLNNSRSFFLRGGYTVYLLRNLRTCWSSPHNILIHILTGVENTIKYQGIEFKHASFMNRPESVCFWNILTFIALSSKQQLNDLLVAFIFLH